MSTTRRLILIVALVLSLLPSAPASAAVFYDRHAVFYDTAMYDPRQYCGGTSSSDPGPTAGADVTPVASNPAGGASQYIAVGNIPVGGKQVGTTTYGGNYSGGKWGPSNNQQGGPQPYDDNGMGNDGKPLPG